MSRKTLSFTDASQSGVFLPPELSRLDKSFTRSIWVKLTKLGGSIMSDYSIPGGSACVIEYYGSGIYIWWNGAAFSSTYVVPQNRYVNIVHIRDITNNNQRLYIDGVRVFQSSSVGSIPSTTSGFYIGRDGRTSTSNFMNGSVGEIRVWSTALTDEQAIDISKGIIHQPENLMAYYRVNEGEGTEIIDYSGNSRPALAVNPVWEKGGVSVSGNEGVDPFLILSTTNAFTVVDDVWTDLGTIPTDRIDLDILHYNEGMDFLDKDRFDELKNVLPNGKGRFSFYTGLKPIRPPANIPSSVSGGQTIIAMNLEDENRYLAFFGEVEQSEFITFSGLAAAVGITNGTEINTTDKWIKVVLDNKVLFTPKKAIRSNISWEQIYAKGAIYGNNEFGLDPYPASAPVLQNARVVINGETFIVRLIKGANIDPFGEIIITGMDIPKAVNSEWNRIFFPLLKDNSTTKSYTGESLADYSHADLGESGGYGGAMWVQETAFIGGEARVHRGYTSLANLMSRDVVNDARYYFGWRPILEKVE